MFQDAGGCVPRCMGSLLAQDYPSLEVLLVDAGSCDDTGLLLDEAAAKHGARVLHLEGRNLADARNAAVKEACGRYLTFVGGEDALAPWYVSALVAAMDGHSDRMVICEPRVVAEDALDRLPGWEEPAPARPLARWQVARGLLLGSILPAATCRLAPREFYLHTPFPSGRLYEELWTCSDYVRDVRSWAWIPTPGYALVLREDSPSRGPFSTPEQVEDFHEACLWTVGAILALYPDMEAEAARFELAMAKRVEKLALPAPARRALPFAGGRLPAFVQRVEGLLHDRVARGGGGTL